MLRRRLLALLAAPLAALFGMGVEVKLLLYRLRVLRRSTFSVPTIAIGNLSVGGAGKTPHAEYVVRLLREYVPVGTLSRGYGRKTTGFRMVRPTDTARAVGDEPLQIKRKFPDAAVAVGEDRVFGISHLVRHAPATRAVVLDDAFQHLAVQPAVNVLLTEYDRPYWRDSLMPVGRLREWRSGADRADAIVVTKCPPGLADAGPDDEARAAAIAEMAPRAHQRVFFSRYRYGRPWLVLDPRLGTDLAPDADVLLVTGIARVDYLRDYLEGAVARVHELTFRDHRDFTKREMGRMTRLFGELANPRKLILTTEKDAMRMYAHEPYLRERNLPLFALPAEVTFLPEAPGRDFDAWLQHRLLAWRA